MLSNVALIVRRPDVTRREFRDHYESVHAPLAIPYMQGLVRYVRNHLQACLVGGEPGFDVFSEFTFGSLDAALEMQKLLASERGDPLKQDERTFMDVERNRFFVVAQPQLVVDGAPTPGDYVKLVAAVKLDDPSRFSAETLAPLLEAAGGPVRCVTHEVLGGPHGKPYDALGFLWFPKRRWDPAAFSGWRPACETALLARVEECESALS